jgi:hypothetical protein
MELETMQVYFGTAVRADSRALDASVGSGLENAACTVSSRYSPQHIHGTVQPSMQL